MPGVRYEYNKMELISNTRDYQESPRSLFYETSDFFPSVNAAYKFSDKHQARVSTAAASTAPSFVKCHRRFTMISTLPATCRVTPTLKLHISTMLT